MFAVFACIPSRGIAQSLVAPVPFTGTVDDNTRADVEQAVRAALVARGTSVVDRATVLGTIGVQTPTDDAGLAALGHSLAATQVVTGRIMPLTGQLDVTLRVIDVATQRTAERSRNMGEDEIATAVASMVAELFAPNALGPSADELARTAAEAHARAEAEALRLRNEADARRRAQLEASQRAALAARNSQHRYAAGGPITVGAVLEFGGRLSGAPQRPTDVATPGAFVFGVRAEGAYTVVPQIGLDVGGTLQLVTTPTTAIALGPVARVSLPPISPLPLRGSAGVALGLFQGISGAQSTAFWLSVDARAEYEITNAFALTAGLGFDAVPGLYSSLAFTVGARVHFGDPPAWSRTPAP